MSRWRLHFDKRVSNTLSRSFMCRWLCALHEVVASVDSSVVWSVAVLVVSLLAVVIQVSSGAFVQLLGKEGDQ